MLMSEAQVGAEPGREYTRGRAGGGGETWIAAAHGVSKSWTQLSNWTEHSRQMIFTETLKVFYPFIFIVNFQYLR